jgi:hypothetical protein
MGSVYDTAVSRPSCPALLPACEQRGHTASCWAVTTHKDGALTSLDSLPPCDEAVDTQPQEDQRNHLASSGMAAALQDATTSKRKAPNGADNLLRYFQIEQFCKPNALAARDYNIGIPGDRSLYK